MSKKMEWSFWLPTIGGALLTVIGVALATWSAITSHNDSLKDRAKADSIALDHKQLLLQNYQKSLNIIDELNSSSEKMKVLLDNNSEVLKAQRGSAELITKQLVESSKINLSIQESGREITNTIKEATKKIDDNLTGGESFCHIKIVNAGVNKFRLAAINNSKNNLPNVIITIENYSEIEKCVIKNIYDVNRIDAECVKKNSITIPERAFNRGTHYFIDGENFIDLTGAQKKLAAIVRTPNHTFYIQMIYKIESEVKLSFLYRVLKEFNGRFMPVESNDDHTDPKNPERWDEMFKIPPKMPTF